MFLEQFLVYSRLVIVAGEVAFGDQLDQVFVADLVLGQKNQVVVDITSSMRGFLFQPTARCHVHLTAYDGFDPFLAGRLIKIHGPEQHPMVRHGHGWKLQFVGLVDQPIQAACPIQQGKFSM